MAKTKKYYVVWVGETPGIYENWNDCQLQIKGYPGAKYKSYPTKSAAEAAYAGTADIPRAGIRKKTTAAKPRQAEVGLPPKVVRDSIAVDAACSGNPGIMEYRGVLTDTGLEIFRQGPFKHGTNNVGEFLALVHGLAQMQKEGQTEKIIYSDSKTAMSWVRKKRCNTTLDLSRNPTLKGLVLRAEKWLKENSYKNPIRKWETKSWGEIPADFGRK